MKTLRTIALAAAFALSATASFACKDGGCGNCEELWNKNVNQLTKLITAQPAPLDEPCGKPCGKPVVIPYVQECHRKSSCHRSCNDRRNRVWILLELESDRSVRSDRSEGSDRSGHSDHGR